MYRTGRLYLLKNSAIIIRTFIIEEEALTLDDEELPDEDDDTPDLLYLYRPSWSPRMLMLSNGLSQQSESNHR